MKLRRAGFENFTIFEKSSGPGGTWWDNRYPGAEVDVSSHLYSFSFMHYDWTCTHAQQAELQQYVEDVIDRFGLRPNFRFSTPIHRVAWDDAEQAYDVTSGDGDTDTFEAVISAVGLLNQPRYPDWPGLDSFAGPAFHTARWEPEHDLTDKTVALVGTGSTAAQIVPAIADVAGRVVIFQREPGWVVPKPTRVFTDDERAALSKPWNRRRERLRLLFMIEKGQFRGSIHRPGRKTNTLRGGQARAYIERTFKDRPDLREAVTPSYPYPGKRPVIAQGYYEALLRDDVELVPFPVVSVTPTGVVDARGIEHPADILVLSTGFQPSTFLNTFDIVGQRRSHTAATSGTASRRRSSASPCPSSRTSTCSTGPTRTAERSSSISSARPSTRCARSNGSATVASPRSRSAAASTSATTGGCSARWAAPRG